MGKLSAALALASAMLLARGGDARADKDIDWTVGTEVGFDLAMGSVGTGAESATGGGITVHYGKRFGRLLVRGELGPHFVSWERDPSNPAGERLNGSMLRTDLIAQVAFARFRDRKELSFDLFVEGGVGREWIAWDGGGELQRNTLIGAVGADYVLRIGEVSAERARALRAFITVRWTLTPSPGQDGAAPGTLCAGCPASAMDADDRARDVGVQLSVGFTFGW